MRELALIHGRSQEHKDSIALKKEWLDTLDKGLAKSGLSLPFTRDRVRFPFYGDTLFDLVSGVSESDAAKVVVRGAAGETDPNLVAFVTDVLIEVAEHKGVEKPPGTERGILNWPWVRALLSAIDQNVPNGSAASIALATRDVYIYLTNSSVRNAIQTGVRAAMTPGVETVVVSHSLGTIVGYHMLRDEGQAAGWKVPLFVTVGSPLAVTRIKQSLQPIKYPSCAAHWFNAMDPDDIVALYPLDAAHFRVQPAIENKTDVDNHTENQHSITGYLNDKEVARKIYDALVSN